MDFEFDYNLYSPYNSLIDLKKDAYENLKIIKNIDQMDESNYVMRDEIYLYHLSYSPDLHILEPRECQNASSDEPEIDRVCLSKSIIGCFLAVELYGNRKFRKYLYRTKVKRNDYTIPFKVKDAELTTELWMLKPVEVELIAEINIDFLSHLPCTCRGDMSVNQINESKIIVDTFKFGVYIRFSPEHEFELVHYDELKLMFDSSEVNNSLTLN